MFTVMPPVWWTLTFLDSLTGSDPVGYGLNKR